MLARLRQIVIPPLWALAQRVPGGVWAWEQGLYLLGMPPPTPPVVAPAPPERVPLPPPPTTPLASVQDVLYCYRLLLLREPDEAGWAFWTHRVQHFLIPLSNLRDAFLLSDEFQRLEAERDQPHLTTVDGVKLFYRPRDSLVGAHIARYGVYEAHVVKALTPLLDQGKVFLDIGANIGYYTLLAARGVGPTGRVLAFEPHPRNVELLTLSLHENGFQHVQVYPYAVSNQAGEVELMTDRAESNASLVTPATIHAVDDPYVIPVRAVVLDEVLKDEPRIDIVKLDIEGVEPLAWQGMIGLIRRHRPVVFTEFSPDAIRHHGVVTPEHYLTMIRQANYRLHILDEITCQPGPAMTVDQIMAQHAQSPSHHMDLVAYPTEVDSSQ